MLNAQDLPVSGGLILAALLYGGVSVFGTGPVIAERTIAKSNWDQSCKAAITKEIESTRAPAPVIPKMDCQSTLGGIMPGLADLCRRHGNPDFGGGITGALQVQERRRKEAEDRRIAEAAAKSGSRCACAANVFIEERRIALALYAGSARLITPAPIKNLDAELKRTLHSKSCALQAS